MWKIGNKNSGKSVKSVKRQKISENSKEYRQIV